MAVDLKDPAGVERVLELVGRAEVFIEGFRPGTAERLGLGPQTLLAARPNLVYARLTGYGQSGPLASEAGHDLNYVAQSGALSALGRQGEAPHAPINLLGDYAGGGALAAFGIVCAVLEARSSGIGQVIDSAMADGVAVLTSKIQGLRAAGLFSDEPGTNFLDTGAPYYDTYRCADGKYLAVGAIEATLLPGIHFPAGRGHQAAGPRRTSVQLGRSYAKSLGPPSVPRSRDEWAGVYAGSDACVTPVLNFEEAAQHPHNAERGMYQRVDGVLHPAPSPRFSRTPARTPQAPSQHHIDVPELLSRWDAQRDRHHSGEQPSDERDNHDREIPGAVQTAHF